MRKYLLTLGFYLLLFLYLIFVERSVLESAYQIHEINPDSTTYYVEQARIERIRNITFSLFIVMSLTIFTYSLLQFLQTKKIIYVCGIILTVTILSVLFFIMASYFNPVF